MHVLIQIACCVQGMVLLLPADHLPSGLGRLKAGEGRAGREMHYPGNTTGRSLGLGPTGDTPRSQAEYRVFMEGQKSCVFIVSHPRHWSGVTLSRGCCSVDGLGLCCVAVAEWFPRASCATVAEKVPGLRGRGLFPEEACYSPIPVRRWLQQWAEYKRAEKMYWCKRGIRHSEVVCRKSGTSKTPRK